MVKRKCEAQCGGRITLHYESKYWANRRSYPQYCCSICKGVLVVFGRAISPEEKAERNGVHR